MFDHRCPKCSKLNRLDVARLDQPARCGACQAELTPFERSIAAGDTLPALVAGAPLPIVVDFWAGWCGPCVMVAPEVEALARDGRGRWITAKLDTEAHPEVAARYRVMSLPTFVLFRDGQEAGRVSGAMPAEGIRQALGLGG